MKYYIYRNSTIENLFSGLEVTYSGYEDISYCDQDADIFIWFYLIPITYNRETLASEIDSYFNNLQLVYNNIPAHKTLIIFSLDKLFDLKFQNSDFLIERSISTFNDNIYKFALANSNVKLIDFTEFTRQFSLTQLIDWKYYFISKIQISPKLSSTFKKWFALQLDEINLKRKKCLVLDLDNTLWGGVLGEEGIEGIKIGGDYPGSAFLNFQQYLIELGKSGVILTVCSKNNERDVLEAWDKNPFIVLKKEHISAYRINWKNKADNISELAEELNIGLDSMVFIDDNPTERELIKQAFPMVEVPDFPGKPYLIPDFLASVINKFFRVYSLTVEDNKKTQQYKENAMRSLEQIRFIDFSAYLKSLNIEIRFEHANLFNISRIAQMTQKTNQFNLTTKRYSESDIHAFINNNDNVYCISVKDKFGDNGITGAIIVTHLQEGNSASIDSLLLSCRILGKGIEMAFLIQTIDLLKKQGIKRLFATYLPTLKNEQVKFFYDTAGFTLADNALQNDGSRLYEMDLTQREFEIKSYYKLEIV